MVEEDALEPLLVEQIHLFRYVWIGGLVLILVQGVLGQYTHINPIFNL